MKILIIEDNDAKSFRLMELVLGQAPNAIIDVQKSYNSGIRALLSDTDYQLVILDMTMPTFDKSESEPGGRMRVFGGRDILSQMKRRGMQVPVIVVTQFDTFGEAGNRVSLRELEGEFQSEYKGLYVGTVFYSAGGGDWEVELLKAIGKLKLGIG